LRTSLAAAIAIAVAIALAIPIVAHSSSSTTADAVTLLQHRVAALERKVAALQLQATTQTKVNRLQLKINGNVSSQLTTLTGQVADLQNQTGSKPSVSYESGVPITVSPGTWGTALASCITGTPVGGGFHTDYPIMVGTSAPQSPADWQVDAFRPTFYTGSAVVTPYVVCLS
jgi:hypothetical protein